MQSNSHVPIDVNGGLFNVVLVDHIVGQYLEPSSTSHGGSHRLHEDQREFIIENRLSRRRVSLLGAAPKHCHRGFQLWVHPWIMTQDISASPKN
jgi:hypothetical protein